MKPSIYQFQLKYIFPAGGLIKSSLSTFVEVKLKTNWKSRDFCRFKRSTLQGFFRL